KIQPLRFGRAHVRRGQRHGTQVQRRGWSKQQPVYIFIEVVCIQGEAVIPEINVETDIILDLSLPAQGVVGNRSDGRARVKYTAEVIAVAVCGGIVAGSTRYDLHELGIDVFVADGSGAA